VTVILQRTGGGVTYSKPLLYPLLAAPAYKLFGEAGMVLVNVLALAAGLLFGWVYLRRIGEPGHALLTLVVFAGASTLLPYLAWRMGESLQVGLALAGTVLVCGALVPAPHLTGERWQRLLEHRWAPLIGGLLLGLLISMRFSNAALAGGALLAVALKRRWRRATAASLGVIAALLLALGLSQATLGTASPYTAERSSFNANLGYPVGDSTTEAIDSEATAHAAARFDESPATHRLGLGATSATLYSAFYFVVGRHTGLLAYFPLALVLIPVAFRVRSRGALGIVAGVLTLTLFYLLYMPHNYFGGSTFLGNRYFLVAYPVLLVALRRLPSPRTLLVVAAVGLTFGGSAMLSVRRASGLTTTSQSHAAAGAFRLLPYESTAVDIQGHPRRFWSLDYVRFVDPWADVKRNHFVLHADRPAAEVMIASRRPRQTMGFLARAHDGAESVLWADWRADGTLSLKTESRHRPVDLTLEPADPWRQHRMWFRNEDTYDVRLLRFSLDGPPASTAEIYYLGGREQLTGGLARELLGVEVPEHPVAGGTDVVRLSVRNSSQTPWQRANVLPVSIGYRILDSVGLVAQERRLLPADVTPGQAIDLEVEVQWPDEPGEYELVVDLWLHPVQWFEEAVGEPLLRRTVRVE